MDATVPTMISKYRVIRVLGRGGMGEVLLAEDDLGRRVAIKRPFITASGDGLARFKVEARAATLSHPNIPVVYEMGTQEDGLPFIAMEFVEGEPLDRLIASGKPMDLLLKLSIVEQICAGLGYAHEKGIIHRDIKPANVIVLPNNVAKIIDFGIAKITNVEHTSELTQASQIIGSLHYIAPERFKAEAVDGRVDIFSAGVILYLMLTGTLPFAGGEMTASYRIVNEAHNSLATHIKDYPPALDAIMDQALAKNPDDRFSTAEDFADALKEVIDDLKRSKINRLFGDAERLTMESRYDAAIELLDEAMKLDSSNTQVRKLRKMVRDHQERRRKQDRLRESIARADSLLAAENYTEALAHLKEAQRLDPNSADIRDRILFVEDKKHRLEGSTEALARIEAARSQGDVTAALRIAETAVEQDPDNLGLLAVRDAIAKQLEREALHDRITAVLDSAQQEFGRRNFGAVETLLAEADAMDASYPRTEEMRAELARVREADQRRQLIEEVDRRVHDFLRGDQYEKASELLVRAIDKLPSETSLHRLKHEVDTAARKFDSERFIDSAISQARQTFANDHEKAIIGLQSAIEQMPGEERLITFERSLREQAEAQRRERLIRETLNHAREELAARHPENAIAALESYQMDHGAHADLDELLQVARQQLAEQERRSLVEKTSGEARQMIREERLDEAARLLESVLQHPLIQGSDGVLSSLLDDVHKQQAAAAHKLNVVLKRATLLRERDQIDDSIEVLKQYQATVPPSAEVQEMLAALEAAREKKQVIDKAVATAAQKAEQHDFFAAFEVLKSVARAYGESEALTQSRLRIEATRAAHAQEVVGHSIASSRAALLENDVPGALAALRTANEMVEFADPARQADWRRIGQAAKKAQAEPPAAGAVIADPLADLPDAPPLRRPASPGVLIGGIVAVCLILAVLGVLLFRRAAVKNLPNQAHINIDKAPAGALVSIDGGTKSHVDDHGAITLRVVPGEHLLEVTKDGYDPYTERFQVEAGETYHEAVPLVKQPLASQSGTLAMHGNIANFKVMIDGHPRGEIMKRDGSFTLEAGAHTIRYSNEDNSDSQEHQVQIAAGKATTDSFNLKVPLPPPPPPVVAKEGGKPAPAEAVGGLVIETTPNAQVSVDGQAKGAADGSGRLTISSLPAGKHTLNLSLDKYSSASGSATVAANQVARFAQPLQPLPPSAPAAGSVSIATNAGAQISLNGQRKGTADGSGQFNLEGLAPGSYQVEIALDHFQPAQLPVTVRAGSNTAIPARLQPEPAPVAVAAAAKAPVEVPEKPAAEDHSADEKGIQAALNNFVQAYKSRNIAAVEANWLNIGAARSKSLAGVFQTADVIALRETCAGQPVISGATATYESCVESAQFVKNEAPKQSNKVITFAKVGGKWVMKDKKP